MRQRVALIAKIRAIESVPVIRFKVRDTFNLCFFNLHFLDSNASLLCPNFKSQTFVTIRLLVPTIARPVWYFRLISESKFI